MRIPSFVGQRLLTLVMLSAITSALSLAALARILSVTSGQRIDRAQEAIAEALEIPERQVEVAPRGLVGVRAGLLDDGTAPGSAPAPWRAAILAARATALGSGALAFERRPVAGDTLVVGAKRAGGGAVAWAGYLVPPPIYLRFWQVIVGMLALATSLLVGSALSGALAFRRSARSLTACLHELGEDLSTKIPRPRVRELVEVADGIERLAQRLARVRSDRDRLGRELAERERLAALGRVVAGVAHEVRNPLASIKLHLDLAAASSTLPEPAVRAVAHASDEIMRLDRLVADLLVVAGRPVGERLSLSVGALARARAEGLRPWAASRDVRIETFGDATMVGDVDSLSRALDNLLRNAVEASPAGGVVRTEVTAGQGTVHLRVEDGGPGVSNDHAAELFEPFFTTKPDGTGLGLALSRSIARAHGGDVSYARQGDRSVFVLSLAERAAASRAA